VKIKSMTNKDADFYPTMGPFLSRRDIVASVGGPVWDEDDKAWFVAFQDQDLVGFGAVIIRGKKAVFCSDYVSKAFESSKTSAMKKLINARLKYCTGKADIATNTVISKDKPYYEECGFSEIESNLKSFSKMQKLL
jgi:hypothetical protein